MLRRRLGRGGAVQDIHILQGGTATYLVRYFRGDLPLYGNGVLSAVNNELATARNLTTFLFENREWLQIDAVGQGSNMLGLEANGAHLLDVPLTVVGSAAITSFELIDDERYEEPEHGDLRTVLALARDGLSRPIYGIEVSWDLDGDGVAGTGDLFRYEYNVDASKVLGGTLGELRAEVSIHAVSGYVFSSNKLGCSMSRPQGEAPPALAFLLASLAAAACLRRRGG